MCSLPQAYEDELPCADTMAECILGFAKQGAFSEVVSLLQLSAHRTINTNHIQDMMLAQRAAAGDGLHSKSCIDQQHSYHEAIGTPGECKAGNQYVQTCLSGNPSHVMSNALLEKKAPVDASHLNVHFIHIPKTGGTSIESLLFAGLGATHTRIGLDRCYTMATFAESCGAHEDLYPPPYLTFSVRSFGVHNVLGHTELRSGYLTWFRDPMSRATSAYYYIKNLEHNTVSLHRNYPAVLKANNFLEYLQRLANGDVHASPEFTNMAVKQLNWGDFTALDDYIWDSADVMKLDFYGSSQQLPLVNEEHYIRARENLKSKMMFVGILEDWDSSVYQLCCVMGWQCFGEMHFNANSGHMNSTLQEKALLQTILTWDIKLYEDALQLHKQQTKAWSELVENKRCHGHGAVNGKKVDLSLNPEASTKVHELPWEANRDTLNPIFCKVFGQCG